MIRRAAALVGTGQQGYALAWLVKIALSGDESMKIAFENSTDGTLSEQALEAVKFTDGSPAVIPELP